MNKPQAIIWTNAHPIDWQAIIWTNAHPIDWHINAALEMS